MRVDIRWRGQAASGEAAVRGLNRVLEEAALPRNSSVPQSTLEAVSRALDMRKRPPPYGRMLGNHRQAYRSVRGVPSPFDRDTVFRFPNWAACFESVTGGFPAGWLAC